MRQLLKPLMLAFAVAWLYACDTTVDRFSDGDFVLVFNVAGFLQTDSDTQFVRVEPIRGSVYPPPAEPLAARVDITDMTTGHQTVLRDSLVQLDSGDTGHLLFAVMAVAPGHSYALRAEDSLGRTTVASTVVPEQPSFSLLPARTVGATTSQTVTWSGMNRTPEEAVVIYSISRDGFEPPVHTEVQYTFRGNLSLQDWTSNVRLSADLRIVRQELGISSDATDAVLHGITMRVLIRSNDWRNALDAENIQNGTGFFGSLGRFSEQWILDGGVVQTLGFVDGQQR